VKVAGWSAALVAVGLAAAGAIPAGCSSSPSPPPAGPKPTDTRDALLDPATCGNCHSYHLSDWQLSMHAYASDDPVFLAMNARGQRETNGQLGTFCVSCHAPMAVRDGKTQTGTDLASVDKKYHGVTCYFCHSVASVDGNSDAPLTLASDLAMRGQLTDAIANTSHASVYSELHDQTRFASASLCGSCHDIVTPPPGSAPIERTYFEWAHSAYASPKGLTCGECHMKQGAVKQSIAPGVDGAPSRYAHDHHFAAVDFALGPGAGNAAAQKNLAQTELDSNALSGALCVTGAGGIRVILDPLGLGHSWPSGASQDRRAWAEVIAYRGSTIVYSSGVVADGAAVTDLVATDPDLWLMRDQMFDAQCNPVDMFWQAAKTSGNELPALSTFDAGDPASFQTHHLKLFPKDGAPPQSGVVPDRVTLRVRLQPIGVDVLNSLVTSKDLDPAVAATMSTFDVSITGPGGAHQLEWTPEAASGDAGLPKYVDPFDNTTVTCVGASTFNPAASPTPAPTAAPCTP
jgi:hypothetical protein